jgi:hypothetical protein
VPDDSRKQTSGKLEAGIRIDFNEPHFAFGVNQKVISKNLESKHIPITSQLFLSRFDAQVSDLLHSFQSIVKVEVFSFQEGFQISVGKLVTRLIFAIIFVFLLDCVICQMSINVTRVIVELFAACSQVAFLVPVGFELSSERCH